MAILLVYRSVICAEPYYNDTNHMLDYNVHTCMFCVRTCVNMWKLWWALRCSHDMTVNRDLFDPSLMEFQVHLLLGQEHLLVFKYRPPWLELLRKTNIPENLGAPWKPRDSGIWKAIILYKVSQPLVFCFFLVHLWDMPPEIPSGYCHTRVLEGL